MNLKTVVPLGAAVVLGLVAAIVARQLVSQKQHVVVEGGASSVDLTDIVVASRDIAPGATLTAEDLTIARVETKSAPANVAANPSMLFSRVAKIQIPRGQIVHESLLAEVGVSGGLPGVIKPGYRAMTIEVNEFTGVAGLLQPGNHIDVLARFTDGESGQTTRTVVQNVQIIAVGTELSNKTPTATGEVNNVISGDGQPPQQAKAFARAITVLVTPAEAERLDLAAANNQARLVLRASTDTEKAAVGGATLASLRGDAPTFPDASEKEVRVASKSPGDDVFGPQVKPTFKPRQGTKTITVIRGGVVSETEVEESKTTENETTAGGADVFAPVD